MQYVYAINSSFTVTSLLDLPLLRDILEACNLKPNYSLLGRELGYDRRTIKSHYEHGTPDPHRHKPSMIDKFYDVIQTLLSDDTPQQFYYKRVLWQYLVDNHGLTAAYSNQYFNPILIENIHRLAHSIRFALKPHQLNRLKLIGKRILNSYCMMAHT